MEKAISVFVLSNDPQPLIVASSALQSCPIQPTLCTNSTDAVTALKRQRFDLFILDLDLEGASDLLQLALSASYGQGRHVLAVAGNSRLLTTALRNQVKHVLRKPVPMELLARMLRTIYSHIILEKRTYFRCPIRIGASAEYQEQWFRHPLSDVVLQDVSQTGLRMRSNISLSRDATTFIDFRLPETEDQIHIVGRVMWSDRQSTSGVQY